MNKKDIAGFILAAAASLTQSNARAVEPPTQCGENQTSTVSAVNGLIGCKDAPETGKPYVLRAESRSTKLVETSLGGTNSRFGSGAQVGAQLNTGDFSLAGNAIIGDKELRALVTAGVQISPDLVAIAGAGYGREDAGVAFNNRKFDGKNIDGQSGYIRVEYVPDNSPISRAFVEYMMARGNHMLLDTTVTRSVEISREDFVTFVRMIERTSIATTKTSFVGDTAKTVRGGATFGVGENGQLTLTLGSVQNRFGNQVIGGVTGEYFGGSYKLSSSLMGTGGVYTASAKAETIISKNWAAYAGLSSTRMTGMPANNMVTAGVSYYPGGVPSYTVPKRGEIKVADSVRALAGDHTAHGVGSVAALGELKSVTTKDISDKVTDTAKTPDALSNSAIQTTMDREGNVKLTFGSVGKLALNNKAQAATGYTVRVLINGVEYSRNFVSGSVIPVGNFDLNRTNTVTLIVDNNTVEGQHTESQSSNVSVNFAKDAPTTLSLSIGSITATSAVVNCSGLDADTISGTCTVKTTDGREVMSWTIGGDMIRLVPGLSSDTSYVVTLDGVAGQRQKNGEIVDVPFHRVDGFKTDVEVIDITPPVICEPPSFYDPGSGTCIII